MGQGLRCKLMGKEWATVTKESLGMGRRKAKESLNGCQTEVFTMDNGVRTR